MVEYSILKTEENIQQDKFKVSYKVPAFTKVAVVATEGDVSSVICYIPDYYINQEQVANMIIYALNKAKVKLDTTV
jgi:hypothetical protein